MYFSSPFLLSSSLSPVLNPLFFLSFQNFVASCCASIPPQGAWGINGRAGGNKRRANWALVAGRREKGDSSQGRCWAERLRQGLAALPSADAVWRSVWCVGFWAAIGLLAFNVRAVDTNGSAGEGL